MLRILFFLFTFPDILSKKKKKSSFDLDYYLSIPADPVTSADKTVITLSGKCVS